MEGKRVLGAFQILNRKQFYFVGNIYAIVKRNSFTKLSFSFSLLKHRNVWVFWNKKKIVLLNYPLVLSLLKYMNVWVFWNKKKKKNPVETGAAP